MNIINYRFSYLMYYKFAVTQISIYGNDGVKKICFYFKSKNQNMISCVQIYLILNIIN